MKTKPNKREVQMDNCRAPPLSLPLSLFSLWVFFSLFCPVPELLSLSWSFANGLDLINNLVALGWLSVPVTNQRH